MKTLHEIFPKLYISSELDLDSRADTNHLLIDAVCEPSFITFMLEYDTQLIARSASKSLSFKINSIEFNLIKKSFKIDINSTPYKALVLSALTVLANEYINSNNNTKK